jgi:hypothetical protein
MRGTTNLAPPAGRAVGTWWAIDTSHDPPLEEQQVNACIYTEPGVDCKSVAKATEVRILYPPQAHRTAPVPAETLTGAVLVVIWRVRQDPAAYDPLREHDGNTLSYLSPG